MTKHHIIYIALAAFLLASCSQETPTAQPDPQPIVFSSGAVTRAVSPLNDYGFDSFGSFTYKETGNSYATVMLNKEVDYINGRWNYSPVSFWDASYDETKFYCYAPWSEGGATFNKSTSTLTFKGSLSDGVADTTADGSITVPDGDVLYGKTVVAKADYGDGVDVNFYHTRATVSLAFCGEIPGYKVRITKITATPDADGYTNSIANPTITLSDDNTMTVDGTRTMSKAALSFTGSEDTLQTDSYISSPTVYFAAPQGQSTADGSVFGLTFRFFLELTRLSTGGVIHGEMTYYLAANVNSKITTMWQPGKRYNYRFRVSGNSISLIATDVYKPDPSTHTYVLSPGDCITVGKEDSGQGADAKRRPSFDA